MTFDKELDVLVQQYADNGGDMMNIAAALVVKAAAVIAPYDNNVLEQKAVDVFVDTLVGFKKAIREANGV